VSHATKKEELPAVWYCVGYATYRQLSQTMPPG
jgi:hypothetical protein